VATKRANLGRLVGRVRPESPQSLVVQKCCAELEVPYAAWGYPEEKSTYLAKKAKLFRWLQARLQNVRIEIAPAEEIFHGENACRPLADQSKGEYEVKRLK
jgi:hypothetical protein